MTTALLWALAVVLIAGGLIGLVLPALPGPVLLFAGFVVGAWAEDFQYIGAATLTVLGVLAVVAYAADFAASSLGASRYGASRRAVVGAAIGAVAGLFLGLIGVVIGPFVGAVIGELSARKTLRAAGRAGFGATLGMVLGAAAKLALGFTMVGVFVVMRFI
jgi:uncharacterized protein